MMSYKKITYKDIIFRLYSNRYIELEHLGIDYIFFLSGGRYDCYYGGKSIDGGFKIVAIKRGNKLFMAENIIKMYNKIKFISKNIYNLK